MPNGVFDANIYGYLQPAGDYLLIAPSTNDNGIGYAGYQWSFKDAQRELEGMGKEFRAKTGKALYVTEAWRSFATQEAYFYDRYERVDYDSGVYYAGSFWIKKQGKAAAAIPGTSNHGDGIAIDFGSGVNTSFTSPEHQAFDVIAAKWGWDNTGRDFGEPWHYKFIGTTDTAGTGTVTPIESTGDSLVATDAEIKAIAAAAAEATVTRLVASNAWTVMANQTANAATRTAQLVDPDNGVGKMTWAYVLANGYSASGNVRSAASQTKIPLN